MIAMEKLICYQRPKRNKPLDEWDMIVASVDPEVVSMEIKFANKKILLTSTNTYLKIDSRKAGLSEQSGYVDVEFFDAPWKELGLL